MINDGNNWGGGYALIQIQGHQKIVREKHRKNKRNTQLPLRMCSIIERHSPNIVVMEGTDGKHRTTKQT